MELRRAQYLANVHFNFQVSPLKSSAKRKDAVAQVPKNPSATEGHGLRSASSINGTSTAVTVSHYSWSITISNLTRMCI